MMSEPDAKSVIRNHIERKCKLFFIEPDTVSGHIENELSVTNNYRGRALFELLQNAIDRAEERIWINFNSETQRVIVANDGKPFSAIKRSGEPRSDLAALCSLHTSNKKPGESIGNKGVGFKSVWEFCHSVQVRTRINSTESGWGIRLRQPFVSEALRTWHDQGAVKNIRDALSGSEIEKKHQGRAPSFYFPEYIEGPVWLEDSAVTAIEMEELDTEDYERLKSSVLSGLLNSTLVFSGDIRLKDTQLELVISVDDQPKVCIPLHASQKDWIRIDIDTAPYLDKLNSFKDVLGFELTEKPRLTLGFPRQLENQCMSEGHIHSYLPTKEATGSPLHIQGDFYLSESRKHIEFGDDNKYNDLLLKIAIDALVSGIDQNIQGIAELPYVLNLLKGKGRINYYLKKHLNNDKKGILPNLLTTICLKQKERRISFYNELYSLIGYYTPSKKHFLHKDHDNLTLKPYFQSFANEALNIVPVEYASSEDKEVDPIVTNACPLRITNSKIANASLFCRAGKDADNALVDVPGVTVTRWRFPESYGVAENLKKFSAWSEYEPVQVLRSIVRAQSNARNDEERLNLLKAAVSTFSPKEVCRDTQWRFLAGEVHPAQRLLIPVGAEKAWADARFCYLADKYPDLKKWLDPEVVFPVDEVRCREVLGDAHKSILKYWGVWDVVPLIQIKSIANFKPALISYPVGEIALKLLAESYATWEQIPNRLALRGTLAKLKGNSWLDVSSGSSQPVSPESVYLGVPNGYVGGYHLINPDILTDREWHLLSKLGVSPLESTQSLTKLVQSVELIVKNCSHRRQIKGSLLSAYRQLIKRINKTLTPGDDELDEALLNRLPIIYEDASTHDRGVASAEQNIWYAPGSQRVSKSRVDDQNMCWWLVGQDVATLANTLKQVEVLRSKSKIVLEGDPLLDDRLRTHLEKEYLPLFMALACYGDINGLIEVDETLVQRRWQGLSVFISSGAKLCEEFGSKEKSVKEVLTHLSCAHLLWEPLLPDSKSNLKLYVIPEYDVKDNHFKKRICLWFAEEIFRRRELYPHFEGLITGSTSLLDFDVSKAVVEDSLSIVNAWLPEDKRNSIINHLNSEFKLGLTAANWRSYEPYTRANLTYEYIISSLPTDLRVYLESLNPIERNNNLLIKFVNEYEQSFAVLPLYADFSHDDWLNILLDTPDSHSFSFDARGWVLKTLRLTEDEFEELAGKIDFDLNRLNGDKSSLGLSTSQPTTANVLFSIGTEIENGEMQIADALIAAIDDGDRFNQQQNNSNAGKNVEEKLALLCAREEIFCLSDNEKLHFFELLKKEYERLKVLEAKSLGPELKTVLKNYLEMEAEKISEHNWKTLIHIGGIADGAGYDVISYSAKEKKLLLIEVKSCRSQNLSIIFSESERRLALSYLSMGFCTENPFLDWRMYFVIEGGHYDVTSAFSQVIQEHQKQYVGHKKFVPEKWKLLGIQINAPDDKGTGDS